MLLFNSLDDWLTLICLCTIFYAKDITLTLFVMISNSPYFKNVVSMHDHTRSIVLVKPPSDAKLCKGKSLSPCFNSILLSLFASDIYYIHTDTGISTNALCKTKQNSWDLFRLSGILHLYPHISYIAESFIKHTWAL